MKRTTILLSVMLILAFTLLSCSSKVDNRVTFLNYAAAGVYVNFKADLYHVSPSIPPDEEGLLHIPPGDRVDITEIFKGQYEYETIYEVPLGATSSSTEGEVAGLLDIKAGTKILVVYTSTMSDSGYTLHASVTSSDDQTPPEGGVINP